MTVLAAGQLIADRYELTSRIAVGGMGEVWEASDTRLGRSVAVKILRPELSGDDEFRHRFRVEARTVASLDHPGIAHVHDYGEDVESGGRRTAYLVMELVRGEPLSSIVARGPVPARETLRIVEQAAWALHAAHDRGFVHRDVKPGNILVGEDGRVKLTDFGIAKAANAAPVTRSGMVMGTAHYIAPEQATGGEATPTGDVYSLGIVAYECLAGQRPFRGDSAVDVAAMQVRDAPPPLPASIPANVRGLIDAVLVKDPAQRYATGREFAEAVAAVRRGEPAPRPASVIETVDAEQPAPARRRRRWSRAAAEPSPPSAAATETPTTTRSATCDAVSTPAPASGPVPAPSPAPGPVFAPTPEPPPTPTPRPYAPGRPPGEPQRLGELRPAGGTPSEAPATHAPPSHPEPVPASAPQPYVVPVSRPEPHTPPPSPPVGTPPPPFTAAPVIADPQAPSRPAPGAGGPHTPPPAPGGREPRTPPAPTRSARRSPAGVHTSPRGRRAHERGIGTASPLGVSSTSGWGRTFLLVLFVLLTLAAVVVGYLIVARGFGGGDGVLGMAADTTRNHAAVAAGTGSVASREGVQVGRTATGVPLIATAVGEGVR